MQDIVFNDEFEEEPGLCSICGADTALTGWNEEKELSRFECSECGAVFVCDNDYNETLVKGEKRNWADFLSANLHFLLQLSLPSSKERTFSPRSAGQLSKTTKCLFIK